MHRDNICIHPCICDNVMFGKGVAWVFKFIRVFYILSDMSKMSALLFYKVKLIKKKQIW